MCRSQRQTAADVCECQHWSAREPHLQHIKSFLYAIIPIKALNPLRSRVEYGGYLREVFDESLVISRKPQNASEIGLIKWSGKISSCYYLLWIDCYTITANFMARELHLVIGKLGIAYLQHFVPTYHGKNFPREGHVIIRSVPVYNFVFQVCFQETDII